MIVADVTDPPFCPLLLFSEITFQGLADLPDTKRRFFVTIYGPENFDNPLSFVRSTCITVGGSTITARHQWLAENFPPISCKPVPHRQYLFARHVIVAIYEQGAVCSRQPLIADSIIYFSLTSLPHTPTSLPSELGPHIKVAHSLVLRTSS